MHKSPQTRINAEFFYTKKHRPRSSISAKTVPLVRLQGFEPWTPWLRVRCSTNWAKDAYLIVCLSFFVSFVPQDMLYYTLWFEESQHFFLFFSFLFFISSFDAILFSDFSISDSEFLIWAAWLLMLRLTVWRFCCMDLNFLFFKTYGLLLCANTFPTSRIFYYMKISWSVSWYLRKVFKADS